MLSVGSCTDDSIAKSGTDIFAEVSRIRSELSPRKRKSEVPVPACQHPTSVVPSHLVLAEVRSLQRKQDASIDAIGDLIEHVAKITAASIQQSEQRLQDQIKIALSPNAGSPANEELSHKLQCKVSACVSLADVMQRRLAQLEKADLDLRISQLESSLLGDKLNQSRRPPLHRSCSVPEHTLAHMQQTLVTDLSVKSVSTFNESREELTGEVTSAETSEGSAQGQSLSHSSQCFKSSCPERSPLSSTNDVSFCRYVMDCSSNVTTIHHVPAEPTMALWKAAGRINAAGPPAQLQQRQTIPAHHFQKMIPRYPHACARPSSPSGVAELVAKYEGGVRTSMPQQHGEQVRRVRRPHLLSPAASSQTLGAPSNS